MEKQLHRKTPYGEKRGMMCVQKRVAILMLLILCGLNSIAQTFVQITHTSGTVAYSGNNVTVSNVPPGTYSSTCTAPGHYQNFATGSQWSYTFSSPVSSVRIPYINSGGGDLTTTRFIVNGVPYVLTAGNITGSNDQCSSGLANVISGGDITNVGNESFFPSIQVDIPGPISTLTVVQTTGNANVSAFQVLMPLCVPGSPLPAIVAMTGGGAYCTGGAGVNVGLVGSAVGINYQLYLGGVPVGGPVAGIGSALSFGMQTMAGVYTATATSPLGCSQSMSGSATVYINPLPAIYSMTGGGNFCTGGTGVAVGLAGSSIGVNYQLYRGGSPLVGTIIAGTGGALSWGLQTIAGTYTVVAKISGPSLCTENMSGTAVVVVDPLPSVYSVTGGGSYCIGGTGVAIGINGSDAGTTYQLYRGTAPIGGPVAGTGTSLSFGTFTIAGTYTVVATVAATGCVRTLVGSATISVNPSPLVFTVTGGGGYCSGGAGINVGLSNSTYGINYQLFLGGSPVGSPVGGRGGAISFGPQSAVGLYTVVATNTITGCSANMAGSVVVSISTLPSVYAVTGGGMFCAGGTGVSIGLASSESGVVYQLYRGTMTIGGTVGGTGSAITFGLQTIAGTYTVAAYNPATGCRSDMSGSATISVSTLPALVTVTGGGGYCTGGAGVNIGLAASAMGIDYQLYYMGSPVGAPVSGTGSVLSFGLQMAAGSYTVIATDPISGCSRAMTGSVTVYIYPLPLPFLVSGGGGYCAGGAGVVIGLSGSQSGVNYQLYRGGLPVVGTIRAGTGTAITFGMQSVAGTYTVVATNGTTTGCVNNMSGSVVVAVNSLPIVYSVTGGGAYCLGGTGSTVGLGGSEVGVNYQLYRGTAMVGGPMAGSGSALDFGLQTIGGVYTVKATNVSTTCQSNMSGSATVTISSLPYTFTVTGGGAYCAGGAGKLVGLAGTVAYTSYQLYVDGVPAGSPVTGIGAAISFGLQTTPGTYTVIATSTITGCSNTMSGSVVISIAPSPTAYTVAGGGAYCAGGAGYHVYLAGSSTGVQYQLYRGGSAVGAPVAGTGSPIDFGLFTTAGTYTVGAVSLGTLCTNSMTGSVTISISALPTAYAVTGGGGFCVGGSGVNVGLAASQVGVNYQLYRGTTPVGTPVAGTGTVLGFGLQTTAGIYTVVGVDALAGCTSSMTGSVTVAVNALPSIYTITGGGGFCAGGTGVPIYLSGSQAGVNYQLFQGGTPITTMAGTGAALSYGLFTTAGVYAIVGTNATTGCVSSMSGSVTVVVNAAPTAYSVTGGGSFCSGSTGVPVGVSSSDAGVNYQLYRGTTPVGSPVAGTGTVISYGILTTGGTYTVVATNATTGCTTAMTGSATIVVGTLPAVVAVTGGGGYCAGSAGVAVGLAASAVGINYQLYLGGSPVGSPVAGTGLALSFGLQTAAGVYTVIGTFASTSCSRSMSGSATVYVYTPPTAFTVTGGGGYCAGTSGTHVYLSGSASGVIYRVYVGGTPIFSTFAGTGSAIDFGLTTTAGVYTVVGTASGTGCVTAMTGSVTVSVNPLPTVSGTIYTVAPGASITLTGSIGGGTWTSSNTSVATVGASSGIVVGASIGTSIISYTLPTGCAGGRSIAVTATGRRGVAEQTAIIANTAVSTVSVMPNPNKGTFSLKGSLGTDTDTEVSIEVADVLGKVLYKSNITAVNGNVDETIQLNNVADGMYLLSLQANGDRKVFLVVVAQ